MKTISANLETHLAQPVTTLATCWRIVRQDSAILGFTDHDRDITYDGLTYLASSGFSPSAISTNSTLSVNNLELAALMDSVTITEADIMAGVWDYAEVYVFKLNYTDLTQGDLKLMRGRLGQVDTSGQLAQVEIRSMAQQLQQVIGEVIGPDCDAELGDSRCKKVLTSFTHSVTVTAVTDNLAFTDSARTEAADYFNYGLVTWLTGNNAGRSMEVRLFASGLFTLFQPMPSAIQVGDTATAIAGCDKLPATCKAKFDNYINFRGFPHLPGMDSMMEYPG